MKPEENTAVTGIAVLAHASVKQLDEVRLVIELENGHSLIIGFALSSAIDSLVDGLLEAREKVWPEKKQ